MSYAGPMSSAALWKSVSTSALAAGLASAGSAFALSGVTGGQTRTVEERGHDSLSALEFMTRAQQADVKAGTALSNLSAALDVRAALQAGIDYCQPLGTELVLPPYPMRLDANPAAGTTLTAMQKGLTCLTSGNVPALRLRGGGPDATRLIPNFTSGVVLDLDGSGTVYSFAKHGWARGLSIYPATEKSGVVGVRMVAQWHFDFSHVHIQNMGSHAMWFPWRGDRGGNTYTINPDGWSCGYINFDLCTTYRNGGWGLLQESGIGGFAFVLNNHYFNINRQGGVFFSGPGHKFNRGTCATNGQDNNLYGWGLIVARRMGSVANVKLEGSIEFDGNWAGNVWLQAANGAGLEATRHNSWTTVFPGEGVSDTQLRPPVHIRLGGSNSAAVAQRIEMIRNNHRSQNVAAGATAEKSLVWYQAHDTATFNTGTILNPFNDSQTANLQRYSQGGGALFVATVAAGAVTGFTRVSGGLGYSVSAPTVIVSGGGGTGATGTAVVDGQVVEVVPTDPGLGYLPGAVLTVTLTGGGGSGATATATVDEWGQVWTYVVTAPGTGYTSAPTASVPAPTEAGTQRQATAASAWSRVVGSITLGAGGSGYSGSPVPDVILTPADLRASNLANFRLHIVESNSVVATSGMAPSCRYRSTAGTLSVAGTGTTPTIIKYETQIVDNTSLYSTSTGQVTVPWTGLGKVIANVSFTTLTAGDIVEIGIYEANTSRKKMRYKAVGMTTAIGGGAGGETFAIEGGYQFTKGNAVDVRVLTSHGSALTISTVGDENTFSFEMLA